MPENKCNVNPDNDSSDIHADTQKPHAPLTQREKLVALGQLASAVAHEINNPLTGVLNNVQLIKMIAEQKNVFSMDEFRELLDAIEESAVRCTEITKSLLDFSHAIKNNFQPFSANEMIEKAAVSIRDEFKPLNISVEKDLAPEIPLVSADAQLMQQLISDIISNAIWAIKKKSGDTQGIITFKTRYTPETKKISILISDTGIGIAGEDIAKIFSPFFTTKPSGEGMGLGLAIAHNIVKRHKGSIEVESEVNKGTTFKISLPALA
jgi:signal transduction histidine kinase